MPIDAVPTGDAVSIRIIKHLATNPTLRWANTYEARATIAADVGAANILASTLVAFERAIHTSHVVFDHATVSTWVPDSQPYNADEFFRLNVGAPGLRTVLVDPPSPLHICLRVTFGAITGRTGFRLYRGCVFPAEITNSAGFFNLRNKEDIDTVVGTGLTSSGLANHLFGGTEAYQLALVSKTNMRFVSSIGVSGITIKALNNKYFDKDAKP